MEKMTILHFDKKTGKQIIAPKKSQATGPTPTLQTIDADAIFAARRKQMTAPAHEDESLS